MHGDTTRIITYGSFKIEVAGTEFRLPENRHITYVFYSQMCCKIFDPPTSFALSLAATSPIRLTQANSEFPTHSRTKF